ncbi:hypothetical protein CBR_g9058 [Chara braunii]|uniref:Uncharacterized protein n=1 Tax=Chara braunii TaxID=69332 RepID=A0A388KNL9_CHABU|nr:hypothetical protein CBR_g9058 [Chara braunii]|eukprot:GBG71642.1 hypothetical protein CBR_g9058 [Chara braunii]
MTKPCRAKPRLFSPTPIPITAAYLILIFNAWTILGLAQSSSTLVSKGGNSKSTSDGIVGESNALSIFSITRYRGRRDGDGNTDDLLNPLGAGIKETYTAALHLGYNTQEELRTSLSRAKEGEGSIIARSADEPNNNPPMHRDRVDQPFVFSSSSSSSSSSLSSLSASSSSSSSLGASRMGGKRGPSDSVYGVDCGEGDRAAGDCVQGADSSNRRMAQEADGSVSYTSTPSDKASGGSADWPSALTLAIVLLAVPVIVFVAVSLIVAVTAINYAWTMRRYLQRLASEGLSSQQAFLVPPKPPTCCRCGERSGLVMTNMIFGTIWLTVMFLIIGGKVIYWIIACLLLCLLNYTAASVLYLSQQRMNNAGLPGQGYGSRPVSQLMVASDTGMWGLQPLPYACPSCGTIFHVPPGCPQFECPGCNRLHGMPATIGIPVPIGPGGSGFMMGPSLESIRLRDPRAAGGEGVQGSAIGHPGAAASVSGGPAGVSLPVMASPAAGPRLSPSMGMTMTLPGVGVGAVAGFANAHIRGPPLAIPQSVRPPLQTTSMPSTSSSNLPVLRSNPGMTSAGIDNALVPVRIQAEDESASGLTADESSSYPSELAVLHRSSSVEALDSVTAPLPASSTSDITDTVDPVVPVSTSLTLMPPSVPSSPSINPIPPPPGTPSRTASPGQFPSPSAQPQSLQSKSHMRSRSLSQFSNPRARLRYSSASAPSSPPHVMHGSQPIPPPPPQFPPPPSFNQKANPRTTSNTRQSSLSASHPLCAGNESGRPLSPPRSVPNRVVLDAARAGMSRSEATSSSSRDVPASGIPPAPPLPTRPLRNQLHHSKSTAHNSEAVLAGPPFMARSSSPSARPTSPSGRPPSPSGRPPLVPGHQPATSGRPQSPSGCPPSPSAKVLSYCPSPPSRLSSSRPSAHLSMQSQLPLQTHLLSQLRDQMAIRRHTRGLGMSAMGSSSPSPSQSPRYFSPHSHPHGPKSSGLSVPPFCLTHGDEASEDASLSIGSSLLDSTSSRISSTMARDTSGEESSQQSDALMADRTEEDRLLR